MVCDKCKFKINCAMLKSYKPIDILIECGLYNECNEYNTMNNNSVYRSGNVKRGTKLLKKILMYKFPQFKWSVVGSHFANGNDINAYYYDRNWTYKNPDGSYNDQPRNEQTEKEDKEIQCIVKMFQEGNVDGMQDMYVYDKEPSPLASTKYAFASRKPIDYQY